LRGVGFTAGQFNVGINVAGNGGKPGVSCNLIVGVLALFQYALRLFLIVPEIGIADAFFEGLQARAILRRVKDSSALG
jgi:hypothetical protein